MEIESRNIERVFILGAGVSKHCGCPLTNDLLKKVTKYANDKDKHLINAFLRYFYPTFNAKYDNYPNIEEAMSLIDASEDAGRVIPQVQYSYLGPISDLRRAILKNIAGYLFKKLKKLNEEKQIQDFAICDFARYIKPEDVIISFNWDLNLEEAFRHIKIEYSYDLNDKGKVTILKPHGSITWFKRKEIKLKEDRREKLIKSIVDDKVEIDVFKYSRFPKTIKDIIPYIVPPTIKKLIDTPMELRIIWEYIDHVLSHSRKINILGYSLPDIDLNFRCFFRTAIKKNENFSSRKRKTGQFFVANPDDSVYLRYRNLLGDSFQFEHSYFEKLDFEELFGK